MNIETYKRHVINTKKAASSYEGMSLEIDLDMFEDYDDYEMAKILMELFMDTVEVSESAKDSPFA